MPNQGEGSVTNVPQGQTGKDWRPSKDAPSHVPTPNQGDGSVTNAPQGLAAGDRGHACEGDADAELWLRVRRSPRTTCASSTVTIG